MKIALTIALTIVVFVTGWVGFNMWKYELKEACWDDGKRYYYCEHNWWKYANPWWAS